ncbi:hypothetical protein KM043_005156 [Ampulex compressa]|nr:hypothetical protein KM043_005156 [Ampulex compressa]
MAEGTGRRRTPLAALGALHNVRRNVAVPKEELILRETRHLPSSQHLSSWILDLSPGYPIMIRRRNKRTINCHFRPLYQPPWMFVGEALSPLRRKLGFVTALMNTADLDGALS